MSELTGPPKADMMVLKLAFQNGRAFAAPAGTSIHNTDAWRPVKSLEELAEFLNVDFAPGPDVDGRRSL